MGKVALLVSVLVGPVLGLVRAVLGALGLVLMFVTEVIVVLLV